MVGYNRGKIGKIYRTTTHSKIDFVFFFVSFQREITVDLIFYLYIDTLVITRRDAILKPFRLFLTILFIIISFLF